MLGLRVAFSLVNGKSLPIVPPFIASSMEKQTHLDHGRSPGGLNIQNNHILNLRLPCLWCSGFRVWGLEFLV